MKTLKTTLLAIIISCTGYTQTYELVQSSSSYQELTNPVDLTGGELWDDQVWNLPIGFDFELFGKNYTTFTVDANGFIIDSVGNAVVKVGITGPDLVDGAFLEDPSNPLPVMYEVSGSAGNQVLKLQWESANVWGADSTNVVNYQIWFYEATGDIAFHFGEFYLDNVPTVTVQKYSQGAYLDDGFSLSGDPASAVSSTIINIKMSGTPSEGDMYTFERTGSSPSPAFLTGQAAAGQISVYPIPATENITVNGNYTGYVIYDTQGKAIIHSDNQDEVIDVSHLSEGLYVVELATPEGTVRKKIVKK